MQINPAAASGNTKKTVLIVVLVGVVLAVIAIPFIFFASIIFFMPLPYQKRTAQAQAEIISVKPTTWSERSSTGSKSVPSVSTVSSGYSVAYKFTTADGQIISQTDDKHRSSDPFTMAEVCYEPKEPRNSGLQSAGKCP